MKKAIETIKKYSLLSCFLFFLVISVLFFVAQFAHMEKVYPDMNKHPDDEGGIDNTFIYYVKNDLVGLGEHYAKGGYGPASLAVTCLLLISVCVYLVSSILSFIKVDKSKKYFVYSLVISTLFLVFVVLVFLTLITKVTYTQTSDETNISTVGMFEYHQKLEQTGAYSQSWELTETGAALELSLIVNVIVCGTLGGLTLKSYFKKQTTK